MARVDVAAILFRGVFDDLTPRCSATVYVANACRGGCGDKDSGVFFLWLDSYGWLSSFAKVCGSQGFSSDNRHFVLIPPLAAAYTQFTV